MATAELTLQIEGMSCGGCVSRVDKALRSVPGVTSAAVNLTTGMANVQGIAPPEQLVAAVEHAGYKARLLAGSSARTMREVAQRGREYEQAAGRRLLVGLILGALVIAIDTFLGHDNSRMGPMLSDYDIDALRLLQFLLASGVMACTAMPFFRGAARAVRHFAANMDVLVVLGAGTAYVVSFLGILGRSQLLVHHTSWSGTLRQMPNELHAAVTIVVLVTLGKYLEARAKKRAASAVAGLATQAAASATRLRPDGSLETIPAESIQIGDRLQILAHQALPVDGQVIEGAGSADMSVVTGESIPVDVSPGSHLPGGSALADGRIVLRAASTAETSTVAKILHLVNTAQASKTRIQGLADRVAAIFVPLVLLLGLLNFAAWFLLGSGGWQPALLTTIATIVIACPCAMGLATPTAITVAMGRAAKLGILFTQASAFESARNITTVIFDKTGTLTTGKPQVTELLPTKHSALSTKHSALSTKDLLTLAASLEQFSEHPFALAIVRHAASQNTSLLKPTTFRSIPGGGITATLDDARELAAGSPAFVRSLGVPIDPASIDALTQHGLSVIVLANLTTKTPLGLIGLRDALRPDAASTLATLHDRNIRIGVLTGDSETAARSALQGLPIDFLHAQIKPAEKAAAITSLKFEISNLQSEISNPKSPISNPKSPISNPQSQISNLQSQITNPKSPISNLKSPIAIAFVGDGINDGPALAAADLGIAMAGQDGGGTDLAKAAGDVLLMNNRLAAIPAVLQLSRHTLRIIRQNLFWAFAYNVAAIPLAMAGILSPGIAAGAMMLSSLTVVLNALRLYRLRL